LVHAAIDGNRLDPKSGMTGRFRGLLMAGVLELDVLPDGPA
jgi:hypothetical protein